LTECTDGEFVVYQPDSSISLFIDVHYRYRNGHQLNADGDRVAVSNVTEGKDLYGALLTLSTLTMDDSGEIRATARNSEGEDHTSATLTVKSNVALCLLEGLDISSNLWKAGLLIKLSVILGPLGGVLIRNMKLNIDHTQLDGTNKLDTKRL
jgi:hypothetical protein